MESNRGGEEDEDEQRRQDPFLLEDQCLQRRSVQKRPEIIFAVTEAIATFDGEDPAVVHIGWGFVRDMKDGLKNDKEGNIEASERN